MKNTIRFFVSIYLIFTFLFAALPGVKACGPYTIEPVFSLKKHADYPLDEYANGKIGIVPSSYGRMSLFVFYRHLNNLPFSEKEQSEIVRAMEHRIGVDHGDGETAPPKQLPDYYGRWKSVRAKITGSETKVETEKAVPGEYYYFTNCLGDAFDNAATTLEARVAEYGAGERVREWIKGQDAVFSNCDKAGVIPPQLGENAPEWLRDDRQYQISASHFYLGDYRAARENFGKIADDENSPWNKIARFVIARTYIREASFADTPGDTENRAKTELHQKAATELENILADASMKDFHPSANRLLSLVKYRQTPRERRKELAEILTRSGENQNIYNDFIDFSLLLDFIANQAESSGRKADQEAAERENRSYDYDYRLKLEHLPEGSRENDLTDWLFTYQAVDGFAHAFEKWKQTGKTQWLVAAVARADGKMPQVIELLSETGQISPDSPAFATVRFHQIRLLMETGKRAEARQKLDEIFSNDLKALPVSAQNKFRAQRMTLAANLDEFLKYAPRKASIFVWSDDPGEKGTSLQDDKDLSKWENQTMFDEDAAAVFNEKMPLSVLREAALSRQTPEHLKNFLVTAVWMRAFVLENQAVEREFTPLMRRYAKEFSSWFAKYAAASNPTNREAAALIAILRYPVLQPYVPVGVGRGSASVTTIDSNRGNWWCAESESEGGDRKIYDKYPFNYPAIYPDFLSAEQKIAAEREHRQMLLAGDSGTFFARRAVEFAVKNPNHPQTPEILHLAVRSTRYGCTDKDTGKFSKQAFDILHQRYPKSFWTKRTPYWFGSLE